MQHCFRIALWMFLLIGYLDTKPIIKRADDKERNAPKMCFNYVKGDLDFYSLRNDVSCGQNVNFTSPTSPVQGACFGAALHDFMNGLKNASINCEDKWQRIANFIESMVEQGLNDQTLAIARSSECKWESKPFTSFVNDLESFLPQLYSNNPEGCH